jgi:hypothetical protein
MARAMSTVAVLGVVWALVGVPFAVRVLQERRPLPMEEFQRAMGALQTPGPNPWGVGPGVHAVRRRRLVSTLTYAPGLGLLAVGLLMSDSAVLAVALALVNLGTAHRLLAVAVDRAARRRPPVLVPPLPPVSAPLPVDPGVDQAPGDAHAWGDGWQIVDPEPRRVDDLVLVDADRA